MPPFLKLKVEFPSGSNSRFSIHYHVVFHYTTDKFKHVHELIHLFTLNLAHLSSVGVHVEGTSTGIHNDPSQIFVVLVITKIIVALGFGGHNSLVDLLTIGQSGGRVKGSVPVLRLEGRVLQDGNGSIVGIDLRLCLNSVLDEGPLIDSKLLSCFFHSGPSTNIRLNTSC